MVVCGRVPDWDFSVSSHGERVLEELFYDPKVIPKTTKVKMHLNPVQEPRSGPKYLRLRLGTASVQNDQHLRMQKISSRSAAQVVSELNRHVLRSFQLMTWCRFSRAERVADHLRCAAAISHRASSQWCEWWNRNLRSLIYLNPIVDFQSLVVQALSVVEFQPRGWKFQPQVTGYKTVKLERRQVQR